MGTLLAILSLFSIASAILFYNGHALTLDANGSASVFSLITLGNLGQGKQRGAATLTGAQTSNLLHLVLRPHFLHFLLLPGSKICTDGSQGNAVTVACPTGTTIGSVGAHSDVPFVANVLL